MSSERRDWEYADGPAVGTDLPITGEPRREDSPGVPADGNGDARANGDHRTANSAAERHSGNETRAVEVADPELSPDVNARLTDEVRAVVGGDRVRVPVDRPHPSRGESVPSEGIFAYIATHRPLVFGSFAGALTIGAVVALATGTWWFLPLAAGLHAIGTMTVWMTIIKMTTVTEHASPELAASLEEQGISNPDERLSELVEEFSEPQKRDPAEVYSPGENQREVAAGDDPSRAASEQSSAITPSSGPSRPARGGGAPDAVIWAVGLALLIASIVIPALGGGGAMWFVTAVMVPLIAGWMLLQRQIAVHGGDMHVRGRGPVTVVVLCTVAAVVIFCAVVALAFQH